MQNSIVEVSPNTNKCHVMFFPLQERPSQVLISHLIENSLKRVSWSIPLCLCLMLHFKGLCLMHWWRLCVSSYWWIQRVSGVRSGRQALVVQRQGAHCQQSVLQQSAERLRQQVSDRSDGESQQAVFRRSCWTFCLRSFRVCVRSRCWDACMVVDGGTSFEFNDGAIATISMSEEDQLRTVVLENWPQYRMPVRLWGMQVLKTRQNTPMLQLFIKCIFPNQLLSSPNAFGCCFLPPAHKYKFTLHFSTRRSLVSSW